MNDYRTVYHGGTSEIVEKKSRFIADVFSAETEEEAAAILEKVKKKYWDARHHCWAFVSDFGQPVQRCSDDGEPAGTAGKPILDVLTGQGLCGVLVVVTRYFGGTLLGTGGLVRAYSKATQEGLADSMIITKVRGFKLKIKTDYTGLGKIQYILGKRGLTILDSIYAEDVCVKVLVSGTDEQGVMRELVEGTSGKAEIGREEECWFAEVEGKMEIWACGG